MVHNRPVDPNYSELSPLLRQAQSAQPPAPAQTGSLSAPNGTHQAGQPVSQTLEATADKTNDKGNKVLTAEHQESVNPLPGSHEVKELSGMSYKELKELSEEIDIDPEVLEAAKNRDTEGARRSNAADMFNAAMKEVNSVKDLSEMTTEELTELQDEGVDVEDALKEKESARRSNAADMFNAAMKEPNSVKDLSEMTTEELTELQDKGVDVEDALKEKESARRANAADMFNAAMQETNSPEELGQTKQKEQPGAYDVMPNPDELPTPDQLPSVNIEELKKNWVLPNNERPVIQFPQEPKASTSSPQTSFPPQKLQAAATKPQSSSALPANKKTISKLKPRAQTAPPTLGSNHPPISKITLQEARILEEKATAEKAIAERVRKTAGIFRRAFRHLRG